MTRRDSFIAITSYSCGFYFFDQASFCFFLILNKINLKKRVKEYFIEKSNEQSPSSSVERLPKSPPITLPCKSVLNIPGIAGLIIGFKKGLNIGGANRGAKLGIYGPGEATNGDIGSGPMGSTAGAAGAGGAAGKN